MRKVLKWVGITLGSLLVIIVLAVVVLSSLGKSKAASGADVAVKTPAIPADSAAVARGMHIARTIAPCAGCHGARLEGQAFGTPAVLVSMSAPNLTRGRGGVGTTYTAEDWDRAIRHGVARDGRRLIIMPSEAYSHMSDADFSALVAYLTSIPAVDGTHAPRKVGLLGGTLIGAGAFPLATANIQHDRVGVDAPQPAPNAQFGEYLATLATCSECHGASLAGQKGGNGPPPGPSLIAHAGTWTVDGFRQTLRTGTTPDGRKLDGGLMPWPYYANMTDTEVDAIWAYIRSVAAKAPASKTDD
ncbi:MAG: cytochrome c [bacterium]